MEQNPLSKYFRKPVLYVTLPTNGIFNPEIEKTVLDEIAVLPMTTLDELNLKNPDALLNAEALISVIKSCVPSIPDPRNLCNIDAESLYMAIRYATYGKELEYDHSCENCKETNSYSIDMEYILDKFPKYDTVPMVEHDGIKIYLRPASVESITKVSLIELEQTKIIQNIRKGVNNDEDDISIAKKYYDSFMKIASQNISLLAETINYIETPEGEKIYDKGYIGEFIKNVESPIVDKINKEVKTLATRPLDLTTFEFVCPNCEHKQKVQVEVNPINFSAAG